jgi:hypothetical protein
MNVAGILNHVKIIGKKNRGHENLLAKQKHMNVIAKHEHVNINTNT